MVKAVGISNLDSLTTMTENDISVITAGFANRLRRKQLHLLGHCSNEMIDWLDTLCA